MSRILIATAAFAGLASGAFAQVVNDECAGAIPISNGVNGPFSNVGATDSPQGFPCGGTTSADVWYSFVASCTGLAQISTCTLTGIDTKLQAYSGACGSTTSLACNDDACGLQSTLAIPVVQGVTYYVAAGGYNGRTGSFSLDLSCQAPIANDECATAIPIGLGPNGPYSSLGASTSSPWPCALGGNDVWFSLTTPTVCPSSLVLTTCNASRTYDTAIEVFGGTCGALNSIVCNDDSCGLGSRAVVQGPLPGATYYVRVGGFNGASGSFRLDAYFDSGNGLLTDNGGGCGAATLLLGGAPSIGGYFEAAMANQIGAVQFLWIGTSAINVPLCASCTLVPAFTVVISGSSFATLVPCDPTLIGGSFGMQAADVVGTTGGCALPGLDLTLTNNWTVTIG